MHMNYAGERSLRMVLIRFVLFILQLCGRLRKPFARVVGDGDVFAVCENLQRSSAVISLQLHAVRLLLVYVK